MPIRNQNWYNLQSTRRYPLDDISTGVDDVGAFIRDDILVDCHIRFPSTLGKYLYVQGLTVSPGLVTAVFGVANDIDAITGTTICAISVMKPVTPYVHYSVKDIVPGVFGWVVFGPGVSDNFSGRYTTPKQTLLQPRSARAYRPLPIPTIGKLGVGSALEGIVRLVGAEPVSATYEVIDADGDGNPDSPAIVFRLSSLDISADYNPLASFLGPCGQRPESGTCAKTPIETINGVSPDCNGNIDITFADFSYRPFETCGGADIVTDVSLAAVCEANKPKKPQEYNDLCCDLTGESVLTFASLSAFPVAGETGKLYRAYDNNKIYRWENNNYEETDIVIDEYCWTDPTQIIDEIVDQTLEDANYPCLTLPLCVDFLACPPGYYFVTATGLFSGQNTLAPTPCNNCNDGTFNPETILSPFTEHGTYVSTGIGGLNIALLKNCATDWAIGRTVTAQLKVGTNGVARNGGLVLNYTQTLDTATNIVTTRYVAVVVDVTRAKLRVLYYTNDTFTEETSIPIPVGVNTWYQLSAGLNLSGSALTVNFSLAEMRNDTMIQLADGFTSIANPGEVTGGVGLFANQSYTFFNKLTVV
jgi:hypothetical protein